MDQLIDGLVPIVLMVVGALSTMGIKALGTYLKKKHLIDDTIDFAVKEHERHPAVAMKDVKSIERRVKEAVDTKLRINKANLLEKVGVKVAVFATKSIKKSVSRFLKL